KVDVELNAEASQMALAMREYRYSYNNLGELERQELPGILEQGKTAVKEHWKNFKGFTGNLKMPPEINQPLEEGVTNHRLTCSLTHSRRSVRRTTSQVRPGLLRSAQFGRRVLRLRRVRLGCAQIDGGDRGRPCNGDNNPASWVKLFYCRAHFCKRGRAYQL